MNDHRDQLRSISWRDICPWLMLTRSFVIAIGPAMLMLALAGALISTTGWKLAGVVFLPVEDYSEDDEEDVTTEEDSSDDDTREERIATRAYYGAWPGSKNESPRTEPWLTQAFPRTGGAMAPLAEVPYRLASPFVHLCSIKTSWNEFAYYLFGGIWSIAVWAFFGAAICRTATLRFGLQQHIGLTKAVRHACRYYLGYFSSPLLPAVPVMMLVAMPALLGLLLRLDFFAPLAGLIWILILGFGFVITLVLFAVLLGWPLMFPTVASECSDSFDAFSRSFSYVYQRPLHYLFYVVVAGFIGMLGWLVVWIFSESVIGLSYWATAWGSGAERINEIRDIASGIRTTEKSWLNVGVSMFGFWDSTVRAVAVAFTYSYFWVATTGIYLLLRKDVDDTELDEIFIEDEKEANLPELESDAAGVPGVAEEEVESEEE